MAPSLYDYLDRRVLQLKDDDVFVLSAVRTWVFAARSGRCAHAMLRSGFSIRKVLDAVPAFLCAMTLLDRYGYGIIRFGEICCQGITDDEARVMSFFAAAVSSSPEVLRIASNLIPDDQAACLAEAASYVGAAMRHRL